MGTDIPPVLHTELMQQLRRHISKVIHTAANGLLLSAEENPAFFKLLFLDTGLVSSVLNLSYQALQAEDLMLVNAGVLAEQYVGQTLLNSLEAHEHPYIHYWRVSQNVNCPLGKGAEARILALFQYPKKEFYDTLYLAGECRRVVAAYAETATHIKSV